MVPDRLKAQIATSLQIPRVIGSHYPLPQFQSAILQQTGYRPDGPKV